MAGGTSDEHGQQEVEADATADSLRDSKSLGLLKVASTESRVTVRRRWAAAFTLLFALLSGGYVLFSTADVAAQGFDGIVTGLTNLSVYVVPLAALALGYGVVVGYEDSGWLHSMYGLPLTRAEVLWGCWLGRTTVFVSAVVVGYAAGGALLVLGLGVDVAAAYLGFVAATAAVGVAFLSLAALVSSAFQEKTHALGAALAVWLWFVLLHDLASLAAISFYSLPEWILTASVVSNPATVYRVLVLSTLEAGGAGGFAAVLQETGLSTPVLAAAALFWVFAPLAFAGYLVGRREL